MKSKLFKYRIVEVDLAIGIFYKIQHRQRWKFHWINLDGVFNTKDLAKEEVKMYIIADNEF